MDLGALPVGMIANHTALQMLLLHAASAGRGALLFGESLERIRKALPDFVNPVDLQHFPDLYLEFPLLGEPFLDVTVLYSETPESMRIASPLAAGTEQMIAWLARAKKEYPDICAGFEIDAKHPSQTTAAVGFQPREHTELAKEFCEITGEPQYGLLYGKMAARMPAGWKPSYLGLFKGRPGSPLRVGGYLNQAQIVSCVEDPGVLIRFFAAAGFTAYDNPMIREICSVFSVSPGTVEFQFDLYPDETVGDIFSVSTSFAVQQPETVRTAFDNREGNGAKYISLLQKWGIADDRWKKGLEAVFAGALPLRDGALTFSLFPQWFKVRWTGKKLQPAKMYLLAKAGTLPHKG